MYECFKLARTGIEAAACAKGAVEDAYLTLTVDALRKELKHISGDKEQELNSMELKADEDVAVFALKFQRLAKEVGVKGQKAVLKFNRAIIRHAPGLVSHVQPDLLRGEVALQDVVQLAKNYSKNQALMGRPMGVNIGKNQSEI